MAKRVTVVRDTGFEQVRATIKKAHGARVRVGLFADTPHPETQGISVAAIGTILEFTNGGQWSFLRTTVDKNRRAHRLRLRKLEQDVVAGRRTVENALLTFGLQVSGEVQEKITDIKQPGNAPATIEIKGFDNPLIFSGFMRANVQPRVELRR